MIATSEASKFSVQAMSSASNQKEESAYEVEAELKKAQARTIASAIFIR